MLPRTLVTLASLALLLLCASCGLAGGSGGGAGAGPSDGGVAGEPCKGLFGRPNDKTGLGLDQCKPACACDGRVFAPPTYDDAFFKSLLDDWGLATPYADLAADPYQGPAPQPEPPETVCAVLPQGDAGKKPMPYTLVTYPSEDAARAAGAKVTHFGGCGVCSPFADLVVYLKNSDLTAPVRDCGLQTVGSSDPEADVACLMKLGFDRPCAQIWAYNTAHTASACGATCFANLDAPYNQPDGGLNPCLQCDEDKSGPVFKAVAGRTRRNSGLANAICRPCSEVRPLVHAY